MTPWGRDDGGGEGRLACPARSWPPEGPSCAARKLDHVADLAVYPAGVVW